MVTEGGKDAGRLDDELVRTTEVRALEQRIRELECVLGKKTLENEIPREALKVARETKLISHSRGATEQRTPARGR